MAYHTDRHIVQALLPVRLLLSVVHYGVADRTDPEAVQVTAWLKAAEVEALAGRPQADQVKLARRSWAVYDVVIKPYLADQTSCAKFALIVFYLLAELHVQEIYLFVEGSAFDQAQAAIYSEQGSVVELANAPALDQSAQKQARRLLRDLQGHGYFREAVPA
ncbi:hypothetical protein [Devosia sp. 1635]|uniref:hypothetical protein n=1 Tax=Devosia sp. 1635 TaxID=2726066 RepID=UPI001563220A|nr:hypothetical protein [Devosia sp. 1635]